MDQFKSWVRPAPSSANQAFCRLRKKNVDIASMGVQALRSHAKGEKHKFRDGTKAGSDTLGKVQSTLHTTINRHKPKQSEPLPSTSSSLGLSQTSSAENDPITLSSASTSPSQSVSQSAPRPVPSSSSASFGTQTDSQTVSHDDSLNSVIWMCVRAAMKNHSFSSNSDLQFYLSKAFPDNPAVSALQLGETKTNVNIFGE